MTLKLEAGKYYRDTEGNKVGPMRLFCGEKMSYDLGDGIPGLWSEYGSDRWGGKSHIIAEWQDEPAIATPQTIDALMQSIYDHAKSLGLHCRYVSVDTTYGVEINKTWERGNDTF